MEELKKRDIYIGVDLSTSGSIVATGKNKIIDVLKYPKPEYDKKAESFINTKIKLLEQQEKSKTKIKALKAEKKLLKRRAIRNYKSIYDFINKYKDEIVGVILEEPLKQMGGFATSADSIASNFTTLGVYTAILSVLQIPYQLYSPLEWHKILGFYDEIPKGLSAKERRVIIKEISIKKCQDVFINADDFILPKGHKKIDDNICEAALLSLVSRFDNN